MYEKNRRLGSCTNKEKTILVYKTSVGHTLSDTSKYNNEELEPVHNNSFLTLFLLEKKPSVLSKKCARTSEGETCCSVSWIGISSTIFS